MNDFFRMGISYEFEKKKINFYTSFDESDIIIASPLGLKFISKNDENANENDNIKQKQSYDFLSSIEILLIDNLNLFLYQNMSHLEEILFNLNVMPKKSTSLVNIHRIGDIFKDNNGKYIRQNILISEFRNLEIECLVKSYCLNHRGIYQIHQKYKNFFTSDEYSSYNLKMEFKFLKIDSSFDAKKLSEFKFNYFTKNVIKSLIKVMAINL
jgi:U3 small nucleolar RNA-associated protein 25